MAIVQITEFGWLLGAKRVNFRKIIFKKNLLLKNHKVDEAVTFHTCLWHHPLHKLCFLFRSDKNPCCKGIFLSLLWLYFANSQMSVYRTIGLLVSYLHLMNTRNE